MTDNRDHPTSKSSEKSTAAAQQGATQRNKQKISHRDALIKFLSGRGLSERQRTAIDLLLRGSNDAQVAQEIGVDRGTVFRWRTRFPAFRQELDRQRETLRQQSLAQLQAMVQPSLELLQRLLTGNDPKAALRAASILLRAAGTGRVFQTTAVSAPGNRSPSVDDAKFQAVQRYVNAPVPGSPSRKSDRIDDRDDLDDDPDEA